jgi:hypothetical protein
MGSGLDLLGLGTEEDIAAASFIHGQAREILPYGPIKKVAGINRNR